MNDRTGNWAEYAVATARQCIPVPADTPRRAGRDVLRQPGHRPGDDPARPERARRRVAAPDRRGQRPRQDGHPPRQEVRLPHDQRRPPARAGRGAEDARGRSRPRAKPTARSPEQVRKLVPERRAVRDRPGRRRDRLAGGRSVSPPAAGCLAVRLALRRAGLGRPAVPDRQRPQASRASGSADWAKSRSPAAEAPAVPPDSQADREPACWPPTSPRRTRWTRSTEAVRNAAAPAKGGKVLLTHRHRSG